jgi:hypothetical protein
MRPPGNRRGGRRRLWVCIVIELSLKSDFSRLERALQTAAGEQLRFAVARALNDCARAANAAINARMGETFDRPTPFTQRAVVAPRALAASKEHLQAAVTVRPLQQKYLLAEEVGGTRTPATNTRKPGASALVLPGRGLLLDAFGNIPGGTLRKLKAEAKPSARRRTALKRKAAAQAAAGMAAPAESVVFLPAGAPGNHGPGGYFRRLAGRHLTRLTVFEPKATYRPRFHFRDQVARAAAATWQSAIRKRLAEAIATAR